MSSRPEFRRRSAIRELSQCSNGRVGRCWTESICRVDFPTVLELKKGICIVRSFNFSDHFRNTHRELIALFNLKLRNPLGDNALGRVDLLFGLLSKLHMATSSSVAPYISALNADTERRPVARQIVDQILAEDNSRYQIYEQIRTSRQISVQQEQAEKPMDIA